jgi:DNA-binding NtrC family response regulator/ligand-binding sensor domain-containing protein
VKQGRILDVETTVVPAGSGNMRTAGPGGRIRAGSGVQQGVWRTFDVGHGLPSSSIVFIAHDRDGDLWFATGFSSGVCRYDGTDFQLFTSEDGLASNAVRAIHRDRKGHLWFATYAGVSRYDGESFLTYTAKDGLLHDAVEAIAEDAQSHLWFATHAGVSRYDGQSFHNFAIPCGPVRVVAFDRDEHLWLGTLGGGAVRLDGETFHNYTTDNGLADNTVTAIARDAEGSLWLGTGWYGVGEETGKAGGGVSRFDGEVFYNYTTDDGLADNTVTAIARDAEDNLWFGTFGGGVSRFDGEVFYNYTTDDGLADNTVTAIARDGEGNLWLGTGAASVAGGGICLYSGAQFAHYTTADGLTSNNVTAILADRRGDLWCATWKGVCRYDGRNFSTLEGLFGNVRTILEDRRGDLWFGILYGGGLCRYDGQRLVTYTTADGLADNNVWSVFRDRHDQLWFGTLNGGISRFDGRSFHNYTTADGLVHDCVYAIAEDAQGDLWFGTRNGISRFDGHSFCSYTTADGLAGARVHSILEDRDGQLWFGTSGGASRFDGRSFHSYTTADGFAHNNIQVILEDRRGHLWFGTYGGGVSRFDGRLFQKLHRWNGLAHNAVLDLFQDRAGDIWIATDGGGVTRYRPADGKPTVHVTDLIANRAYGPVSEVSLPGSHPLASFEYRGVSFRTGREQLLYVHRLEGRDTDWQVSHLTQATYPDLELGEYVFQVRAVDRDFNYSDPATVRLSVVPDPHLEALNQALSEAGVTGEFIGESPALRRSQEQLAQVAATDLTVLILGETGTGKSLATRFLHALSKRPESPFIQINCGAIPANLVESELFGHEKGAFTGATSRKLGKVELAEGGTLFLDEIGDMPLEAQVKLLRLLEERTFERVGGTEILNSDARVVAATNRDLEQMVQRGEFRRDLYFRLQAFPVTLPPLRERQDDIPLLAAYFAERAAANLGREAVPLEPSALLPLERYDWPGNVRELEQIIQRAILLCSGPTLGAADILLPGAAVPGTEEILPFREFERRYILQVLEKTGWVVKGDRGAAALLGMHDSTLRGRMRKLSIHRPSDQS